MKITDMTLRSLPHPDSGQTDYHDESGLIVRVGKRTKTFQVRLPDRKRLTLGHYPDLGLAKAREKAKIALYEAAKPKDEEPATLTFVEALERFYALHVPSMRRDTQRQCVRLLNTYFKPPLANRKLPSVRTSELATLIDGIEHPSEKRNSFIWLRLFLNWSWQRGYLDINPISRLRGYSAPTTRDRVLSDKELAAVWQASHEHHSPSYGALVRVLILTAQRRGQFLPFDRSFIQGDTIVWPPERMKMAKAHTLPLTDVIRREIGNHDFGNWATSYSKRALDQLSGVSNWTLHDLRRTAATGMATIGIAPHVIERVLAHQTGVISGIALVYNRAAYLKEMREALTAWDDHLTELLHEHGLP